MKSRTDKVDELFAEWDKSDSPSAALAIIKGRSIIYKRGYGSANLDYNVLTALDLLYCIGIKTIHRRFHRPACTTWTLFLDDDLR